MISVDECQVHRGTTSSYGWSKKGSRALYIKGRTGKPLCIVTATRPSGLLGYIFHPQRIDQYSYKYFLSVVIGKLKELEPVNYRDKFFIFMDNATAHKTKLIKDYCEIQGITVLCNAPMTPQLQPIEFIFSMFK